MPVIKRPSKTGVYGIFLGVERMKAGGIDGFSPGGKKSHQCWVPKTGNLCPLTKERPPQCSRSREKSVGGLGKLGGGKDVADGSEGKGRGTRVIYHSSSWNERRNKHTTSVPWISGD